MTSGDGATAKEAIKDVLKSMPKIKTTFDEEDSNTFVHCPHGGAFFVVLPEHWGSNRGGSKVIIKHPMTGRERERERGGGGDESSPQSVWNCYAHAAFAVFMGRYAHARGIFITRSLSPEGVAPCSSEPTAESVKSVITCPVVTAVVVNSLSAIYGRILEMVEIILAWFAHVEAMRREFIDVEKK